MSVDGCALSRDVYVRRNLSFAATFGVEWQNRDTQQCITHQGGFPIVVARSWKSNERTRVPDERDTVKVKAEQKKRRGEEKESA